MSKKNDYTEAEWRAISGAPLAAGLLITVSDPGPVGIAKEAMAVGKAISQSTVGDAPEIVKGLARSVTTGGGHPEVPDLPAGNHARAKDALMDVIKTAVGAIQTKSPSEVEGYKTWLASVTAKVSHASKKESHRRIGGELFSRDEEEALKQLAGVLGVGPRQSATRTR